MATIKDIAKCAGVSVATVSRVANNGPKVGMKTRQRVQHIMQEMGYRPNANARALVKQQSTTLGVVVAELKDPFFALLAHSAEEAVRKQGGQMLLSSGSIGSESERQAIEMLMEHRCQSMVVHSKALSDQELVSFSEQIPGFVIINRLVEDIPHRCVWVDNQEGGRLMAEYMMAQKGHDVCAVVVSDYAIQDPAQRLQGIQIQANTVNAPIDESLIAYGSPDETGGEQAVLNLLQKNTPFTGLLCYNDAMAIGAITALLNNGLRVPQDVSVIGFDDILHARYSRPALTTLRYPIAEMAQYASQLALKLARNKQPADDHLTPTPYAAEIIERQSVRAMR